MAFSPAAIESSTLIRPYALQDLALTLALLFFLRFVRTRGRGDLYAYAASSTTAVLLQYGAFVSLGAFVFASIVVCLVVGIRGRQARDLLLAQVPASLAAVALFTLHIRPTLMDSAIRTDAVRGWLASQFVTNPDEAWRAFVGLFDFLLGVPAALAGALAFVAGVVMCAIDRRYALLALNVGALGLAAAFSALSLYPFGGTRHSIHLAPVVFATIAYAVARAVARGPYVAVSAASLAVALVVAAAPTAVLLGLPVARSAPVPEDRIPVAEGAALRAAFDEIRKTPGVILVDRTTAYRLSPILRETAAWPRSVGSPSVAVYGRGERPVVAASVRSFDDGGAPLPSSRHLSRLLRHAMTVPEIAVLVDRDSVVVASDQGRTIASIRRLSGATDAGAELVVPIATTGHFEIFRLDAERYRATLQERREALRRRRGRDEMRAN